MEDTKRRVLEPLLGFVTKGFQFIINRQQERPVKGHFNQDGTPMMTKAVSGLRPFQEYPVLTMTGTSKDVTLFTVVTSFANQSGATLSRTMFVDLLQLAKETGLIHDGSRGKIHLAALESGSKLPTRTAKPTDLLSADELTGNSATPLAW